MSVKSISLSGKYTQTSGRVFLSGTQALVKLPLLQRRRDLDAGLKTAGFISGYRGSPLGTYDSELWKVKSMLKEQQIHFEPGVNEDLAATAVWGSQQAHTFEGARFDGVFAIWYGKGPGVDRSGDPIRHANVAGTAPLGGVLLVFGDDHAGKSSTVAHQSEQALSANMVPILYPASVQEIIDFGLLGWAMSRFAGTWVGLKCVNETVENTATVDIDDARSKPIIPADANFPPGGVNFSAASQHQFLPTEDERRLVRFKLPLVQEFVRSNAIDKTIIRDEGSRLGIVSAGKSFTDCLQALQLLDIDDCKARALGISLYKPGLIWPLDPQNLSKFAAGLQELFFVEEKRAFMEEQATRILFNMDVSARPRIVGKTDEAGNDLLPSDYVLSPREIALAIASRLAACGIHDGAVAARASELGGRTSVQFPMVASGVVRTPYFCSGCPHNSSTVLPQGSLGIGGIGCHGLGIFMGRTQRSAHMGGEGLTWAGAAPFTDTKHVFQNLGDGTYSHSGLLAIHGAVTSKVNITYKILFNDAVAMTGGQPVEGGGQLTVPTMTRQLAALGVKAIRVVTDEPHKYPSEAQFASGVTVHHRSNLDAIQRELRSIPGTTALIYDQTCAAEKRRRRKRGTFPESPVRAFINEKVCEGCGDCSVKSNCVSVLPLETELGRKREIDQTSCNQDISCIDGFCPSFVTVVGGKLRARNRRADLDAEMAQIPAPKVLAMGASYSALISGVGGTGIVTMGAILGMAAHMEGKGASIFDMTGIAQKGGSVFCHLKIARDPEDIKTVAIGLHEADLVLGCDLIVTGSRDSLRAMRNENTVVVLNTKLVPTGEFQRNPDMDFQAKRIISLIQDVAGSDRVHDFDATAMAVNHAGSALSANMILVGYAFQIGAIPLSYESIDAAIELNNIEVAQTRRAFALGRLFAHHPQVFHLAGMVESASSGSVPVESFVEARRSDLVKFQNKRYAEKFTTLLDKVRIAEKKVAQGKETLLYAVARSYFKLLAYKDEYEVARLYTDGDFKRKLDEQFEGDFQIRFHLAPPIFSSKDPVTGQLRKRSFGSHTFFLFKMLAALRGVRGSVFDIFGYTEERRMERRLIVDFEQTVEELLALLNEKNHALAVSIAEFPLHMRGYGHVKQRNVNAVTLQMREDLAKFRNAS